jgi:hypothetical protein
MNPKFEKIVFIMQKKAGIGKRNWKTQNKTNKKFFKAKKDNEKPLLDSKRILK